jgi:uncharacterized membrane-anchored protein YitT (DUF2179 family)
VARAVQCPAHRTRHPVRRERADIVRVGDVILGFNVVLFLAAITILRVEPALYSILTYITAAKTLDFVLYGLDEYTAITVMSSAAAFIDHTRRGKPVRLRFRCLHA